MKSNAVTFLYKFSHRKWHHSERDSKLVGVSIHVPTRGTTESIELDVYFKAFQSTFPQGERHSGVSFPLISYLFQSTFPQGERRISMIRRCYDPRFNPRSRKGNDSTCPKNHVDDNVSIHVPARGTTLPSSSIHSDFRVSIHVPARGTTFFSSSQAPFAIVSIHVPARGTTSHCSHLPSSSTFQSTFPQGERRGWRCLLHKRFNVSIHVPARGTTGAS